MKKILFLITQSEMGGAQRFLLILLRNLDQTRFSPVVASGRSFHMVIPSEAEESLLQVISTLGIRTVSVRNLVREIRPIKDLKAFFEIRKLLKEEKPDILYLLSSKAGFLGALAGRLQAIPKIVCRIGGFAFHEDISTVKRWLYFLAEKMSASWKDLIIVNNRRDQASAGKLGFSPERIRYIPNGLSEGQHFLSREEARAFFRISSPDLVIGTIANFYQNKGLSDLLDALALMVMPPNLPPLSVLIIGDGRERHALEQKIKILKLSFVRLVGSLPNASEYLKAFDLFVLPSRKEGMPWVLLEAMLAKVPIVATNVGGIPELLENEKEAFLVPPKNPLLLMKALSKALQDAALRSAFATHANDRLHRSCKASTMIEANERCFEFL